MKQGITFRCHTQRLVKRLLATVYAPALLYACHLILSQKSNFSSPVLTLQAIVACFEWRCATVEYVFFYC